ncbi:hypothetical protein FQN54_009544 [Arachnomyces sp. PD_36]|nr:hypothetical protein FQN54_009544 [Arachnomyces sp. PD_36]
MSFIPSLPFLPASILPFLHDFHSPPPSTRPLLRWWWPHALVSPTTLLTELSQISTAGFGGVEIQDVHHSVVTQGLDPAGHGWGTEAWVDAVGAVLLEAKSKDEEEGGGMRCDFAMGPSWPVGVPGFGPDDEGAEKEVVGGWVYVEGGEGYRGDVVRAGVEKGEGVGREELFALQGWRVSDEGERGEGGVVLLDFESGVDVMTGEDGGVEWIPPGDGTWVLLSAWVRGSGQKPEGGPHTVPETYVVDHFAREGVDLVVEFWEENILSDEFRGLLLDGSPAPAFIEDSIELEVTGYWTPDFPGEFLERRGYDVRRILPAILQEDEENIFAFSDEEVTRGVRNDYYDTLSELYLENHVEPLKEWIHSLGMRYRAQAYGIPGLDGMKISTVVDIPEGESLGFTSIDNYRSIAGAAGMSQTNIISNEACAYEAAAYMTTWAKVLRTLNPQLAIGVNQNVLHGFSYETAPGATWPGFAAFTPLEGKIGYSESWGPRQPAWHHAPDITAYLGRVQLFMRQGTPKHDCALFRQGGATDANYVAPFFTSEGARVGWSANYIDPALLELPTAYVEDGKFAPDAASYAMMAVHADVMAGSAPALSLDTAERLRGYARDGLPMLWIGDWSSPRAYGYGSRSDTEAVKATVEEILMLPNVVNVNVTADIPDGVKVLGVRSAVRHDSADLVHLHREDGELDHFLFVANSSEERVDVSASLPRRYDNAVPISLNPWTGEVSVLPLYQEVDGGRISIPLALEPFQSALITLMPVSNETVLHAVNTTAQRVTRDPSGSRLLIHATSAGNYTTTLSDGKTYHNHITSLPPPINLTAWTLTVDDWQPANGNGTTGNITETKFVRHTLNLTSLLPWTSIPELEDVSGNGTYTTTFTLDDDGDGTNLGAYLHLSPFNGSFRIKLNGENLPPLDQLATEFDIGKYVNIGVNVLEIEIATSLLNRMRIVDPGAYGGVERQGFGLVGVRVLPYRWKYVA